MSDLVIGNRCPKCGGESYIVVRLPDAWTRSRVCNDCGTTYAPPPSMGLALALLAIGITLVVVGAFVASGALDPLLPRGEVQAVVTIGAALMALVGLAVLFVAASKLLRGEPEREPRAAGGVGIHSNLLRVPIPAIDAITTPPTDSTESECDAGPTHHSIRGILATASAALSIACSVYSSLNDGAGQLTGLVASVIAIKLGLAGLWEKEAGLLFQVLGLVSAIAAIIVATSLIQ